MKKTFLEVIAEIKEGEIWVNKYQRVSTIEGKDGIAILKGGTFFSTNNSTCIDVKAIYELERRKYSFAYVVEEYLKGKEIESVVTNIKFKVVDGIDFRYSELKKEFIRNESFMVDEIKGGWYING